MKFQPLLPVASALAVAAFVISFSTPGATARDLPVAPSGVLPIGIDMATSSPAFPAPRLGGLQLGSTGNPLLDRLLAIETATHTPVTEPEPATTTEPEAPEEPAESTTSPAAAAVGAAKPEPKPDPIQEALMSRTNTLRESLVNIICIPKDGLKAVSGTGVIIDSRGIVLTVAHIAQMYLLEDYPTEDNVRCVVRTGSPASTSYRADLVYVSPDWIRANPDTLVAKAPRGTGQHDFALLVIREGLGGVSMPASFPAVPLSTKTPQMAENVGIGTYGAQYLTAAQVRNELYPTVVFANINNRYTFDRNTVDVISVNGGAAAQQGSSGGAIVNLQGELTGLITTSETTGDFAIRSTRAITPRHIRDAFEEDTGEAFEAYLAADIDSLVQGFADEARRLRTVLANAID